jgi:hypothetical protein
MGAQLAGFRLPIGAADLGRHGRAGADRELDGELAHAPGGAGDQDVPPEDRTAFAKMTHSLGFGVGSGRSSARRSPPAAAGSVIIPRTRWTIQNG